MSLLPTRTEFATEVFYTKVSGDANMPSPITCYVESTPVVRGVYKKKIFFPKIASFATAATTTIYAPAAGTKLNMVGAFKTARTSVFRGATSEGGCYMNMDESNVQVTNLVNTATVEISPLDIETIGL